MAEDFQAFIQEAIDFESDRSYIPWEFFYTYKDRVFQCTLMRETHYYEKEMRELLLRYHVGAPNPVSIEKLFKEALPRACRESHYTPRMSYF